MTLPADRPYAPAAERNRVPIGEVLLAVLPREGRVLEIGGGTGQHARHFAEIMPGLRWLPTEHPAMVDTLAAGLAGDVPENIAVPVALDVAAEVWPRVGDGEATLVDAVFTANTFHIMPWEAVLACIEGVAALLKAGGQFIVYGPFRFPDEALAPSNEAFDASLKRQDPAMGLRELAAIERAMAGRFERQHTVAMPANNHMLIWRRLVD